MWNQPHPPLKKEKSSDGIGNDYRDLLLKKADGSTSTICRGLTLPAARLLSVKIHNAADSVGGKLEGKLLIVFGRKPK